MEQVNINKDLQRLIPPLGSDEKNQLEANCLADGIRDALVIAQYPDANGEVIEVLADGHNRYDIARRNNLPFKTEVKQFTDYNDVKVWMIRTQFGRRNINNYQRSILALELEGVFRQKAKENQRGGQGGVLLCPTLDKAKIDTKKELAKIAKVSHGTLAKVKKISAEATPELKQKLATGELSVNGAYKEIKKHEKQQKLEIKKQDILKIQNKEVAQNPPTVYKQDCKEYLEKFKDNSIDLLLTDPPYSTDVDDIKEFAQSWLPLALSKVKKSGRAFICIGAYPKELNAYLTILLNQDKFIVDNPLIWTYRNTLGITPKMKYNLNYQVILHLYSTESRPLDTGITNEMFSVQDINAPDGRQGNRYHTWQKPNELGDRLVRHSTIEGDKVVDCFCCTGTFILSAAKLNRVAEGCDNSEENLLIAKKRGCKYDKI